MTNNKLTTQEKQERAWTRKRVHYHNIQAKGTGIWMEQAQKMLMDKMSIACFKQIFVPLHLKETSATDFLFVNAKLNKIHSMYCDLYEELPYRPDMAFDVVWRAFEVMSKYYSREIWGDQYRSDSDMFHRVSKEIVLPVLKADTQIDKAFRQLISVIPDSTLRFMVVRLYLKRELGVLPQLGPIKMRTIGILSQQMYDDFYKNFFGTDGSLMIERHRSAVQSMRSIFMGETVDLNGNAYKSLCLENRIELLMSCVLYVSRCERYHGDYMSQFKSSMAKLATYHNFYYLLTITDLLFWIVWYKFSEHQGLGHIFSLDDLARCSEQRLMNIETVFG